MSRSNRNRKPLPAIREESPLKTKRIPVHIIPPGASLQRMQGGAMIIQNLPEEPPKPPPKVTPSNRQHDNVNQIVSDYLHFAKYGEVLPVTQGFAPNVCPCCVDRNRENMQMLRQRNRAPPEQPDPESLMVPPETGLDKPDPTASVSPRKVGFSDVVDVREVSPRKGRRPTHDDQQRDFPSSWMDYQPLPHARTYLNPEFNRVSLIQGYEEDRRQHDNANMEYVSGRVLDANTKYDLAMQKLQRSLRNFSEEDEDPLL